MTKPAPASDDASGEAWTADLAWPPDAKAIGCGLHNLGNTCFVNSVLQCLTHTPPLALGCLQHREDVLRALPGGMGSATVMGMLADHIRDALTSDKRPFTPSLASQMHEVSSYLTPGQQECAHEFVRFLFDAASRQTTSERRAANGSRPFIEQLFLGQLSSTVRCAACGGVSHSADDFLDLSLEIGADGEDEGEGEGLGRRRGSGDASAGPAEGGSGGQYSLLDALGAFLRVEQLDADQYYCERCDGRVCAEKQLALSCLPPVLLLHLKRFRYRQKVGTHVACPPLLDLAQLGGAERGAGEARGAGGGLGGEANGHAGGGDGAAARAGSPPHPQAGAEPPAASGSSAGGAAGASSRNGSAEGARSPSSSRRSATAAAEAPGGRREGGRGKQLRGSGGAETRGPAEHGAAGAAAHAGSAGGGGEASERGRYVLYGVIVHRGRSQTSGHYIAYVHALDRPAVGGGGGSAQGTGGTGGGEGSEGSGSGGSWWCFDDSHVYPVDEACVLSQPAYMCFYARQSWWGRAPRLLPPASAPHAAAAEGPPHVAEAALGLGAAGGRLWLAANVLVLVCCACYAHAQLELLTAETRWSAGRLSALGELLGARLRALVATAELQPNRSFTAARRGDLFGPGATLEPSGACLSGGLPPLHELPEGLGPVLLLVLFANFSLKHVLGSLSHLAAGSGARAAAAPHDPSPAGYD